MASTGTLKKSLVITGMLISMTMLSSYSARINSTEASPMVVKNQVRTEATYVATPEPEVQASDRMSEIRDMLSEITYGQAALKTIDENATAISFVSGAGSFYNYWDNTVVIELDVEISKAALLFVHEATHVRNHKAGLWLHPEDANRADYVNTLLEEEAEAEANVVEAKLEFEAAGFDVATASSLLEMEYRRAYRQGIEWEMMTNRNGTEAEWERNARESARSRLSHYFLSGKVVRSDNGLSYGEFYGNDWDKITLAEVGIAGDLQTVSHEEGWFSA